MLILTSDLSVKKGLACYTHKNVRLGLVAPMSSKFSREWVGKLTKYRDTTPSVLKTAQK